jgi:predicted  nucleic acid-binding Zn-ribbon protein
VEHETDPMRLGDAELAQLIADLTEEEHRLSAHRTALHRRLEFLEGGGYAHLDASAEQLVALRSEEREVSTARRALHARLDRALAERHARAGSGGPGRSQVTG